MSIFGAIRKMLTNLLKLTKSLKNVTSIPKGISLRLVLVVPLVLHIFVAVALVGHLSLKNCHQTVHEITSQLTDKVSNIVNQHLNTYLETPRQVNQLNINAIKLGLLNIHNFENTRHYFQQQMQVFNVDHIGYRSVTGKFIEADRRLKNQGVTIDEINYKNRHKVVQAYNYKALPETEYLDTVEVDRFSWSQGFNRTQYANVF